MFSNDDPRDYVQKISSLSPNFVQTIFHQIDYLSYRKLGELMGLEGALDSALVKAEMLKLKDVNI